MSLKLNHRRGLTALTLITLPLLAPTAIHAGYTLKTLTTFAGGADGDTPFAGVTLDAAGNLYGTTNGGGTGLYGTVYRIAADAAHTRTTLVNFDGINGSRPDAGVTLDAQGNIYGTTYLSGTVYRVSADASHTLTTIANLSQQVIQGVTFDAEGNLYGTTFLGGKYGYGTVFQVSADPLHTVTTLANFDGNNGSEPYTGKLTLDAEGNIYGTTFQGGSLGFGTAFRIANDPSHALTTLVNFGVDVVPYRNIGENPFSGLTFDAAGNLYGTTSAGGVSGSSDGTVYQIAPDAAHTVTVLASFTGGSLHGNPLGSVVLDAAGNIYGTTQNGGDFNGGSVFRISGDASHTLTTLASFVDGHPYAGVTLDAAGNIYGVNTQYGTGHGEVFELVNNDAVVATPEPTTLVLAALGVVASLTARYRKSAVASRG